MKFDRKYTFNEYYLENTISHSDLWLVILLKCTPFFNICNLMVGARAGGRNKLQSFYGWILQLDSHTKKRSTNVSKQLDFISRSHWISKLDLQLEKFSNSICQFSTQQILNKCTFRRQVPCEGRNDGLRRPRGKTK